MTLYDEINMLVQKLSDEWGTVVISCDEARCSVSPPGTEETSIAPAVPLWGAKRRYRGETLLEALRAAAEEVID